MSYKPDSSDLITDILQGYSVRSTSLGLVYFKHLSQERQREILSNKAEFVQEADENNLPTEAESLEQLDKQGLWGEEQENEIKAIQEELDSLNLVSKRLVLPSQKKEVDNNKKELQAKINELNKDRSELVGMTREAFIDRCVQKRIMESSLFYDKEFTDSVFEEIYINERLKEVELYKIQANFLDTFGDDAIAKAVLSDHYSAFLPFSEDVFGVFGKPLIDLTLYQLKLASYGRYFLNIFKNCPKEIPDNVARDPDLLVGFFESARDTGSSVRKNNDADASTYFGATQDDINLLKDGDENAINLSNEVKKKGGSLNMKEMMELHGV